MSDLRELQAIDSQAYADNKLIRRAVERTLHLAVEACLDVGQHIIAREGFRRPDDNRDVFVVLREQDIIPAELLPRLVSMAKFRNLIVHDYARIDNDVVLAILRERLDDFDAFARAVVSYLG